MNARRYLDQVQNELILAASIGNFDGVLHAIKNGAHINAPLPDADTEIRPPYQLSDTDRISSALHIAVRYGHMDIAKLLLNQNADANQLCNSETPLMIAARMQNFDMAYLLLQHGATVNYKNQLNESAYLIAKLNDDRHLTDLLLSRGADKDTLKHYFFTQIDMLAHYGMNGEDDSINEICNFFTTHSSEFYLSRSIYLHSDKFRKGFLAARNGETCLALLRFAHTIAYREKLDIKDLLPSKYTFKNYYLKEEVFASIKALPLSERLELYDAILQDTKSPFSHFFHMKRGYIFGVSETRGILYEISQAYQNDKAELRKLQNADPENSPDPIKQESNPSPTTIKIYPNLVAVDSQPSNVDDSALPSLKAESNLYPDLKKFHAPQSDVIQEYLEHATQNQAAASLALLNPLTGEPLPVTKTAEPVSDPLAAIDTLLHAPAATKKPSWLHGLDEIDFSGSSTAVILNTLGDLISFEEPAKPYVNPFDELIEQEKQTVAVKQGYINPFDDVAEDQREAEIAADLDSLPKVPSDGVLFTAPKVSQSNTDESGKKRIAVLN